MRHVIAVHMEGADHLEHIGKLRWVQSNGPNLPENSSPEECTRQQMYDFLVNGGQGFAVSRNDNTYAYLEPVNGQHVQYVKTLPDSTRADNLLSLPRY